jgi:glycine betaine/proline transport system substrate-binding protein
MMHLSIRRYLNLLPIFIFLLLFTSANVYAYDKYPGKGKSVRQARCTWDTGYFHETLVRRALKELGYNTPEPRMLQNVLFYTSVYDGTIDFWANSWLPNQYSQMPKRFSEKAGEYGYVMKSGGLQGYMVDKKHQQKFNITSLADFKRPEVKKAFDHDKDGKADLFGSPPGWKVTEVMKHHIRVYGLEDHVNFVQAAYNVIFADVLANYKDGGGVLFYTWAPNWTISKLKPGEDVMWINVPEIKPLPEFTDKAGQMVASGIVGAVSDPIKLGFIINDVRIVANKKFMADNPAAKKLFEVFRVPVADISAQNAKMKNGEKTNKDIERHVDEWIAANTETWNSWLETARKAAP